MTDRTIDRKTMESSVSEARGQMSPEGQALLDEIIENLAKDITHYDAQAHPNTPSETMLLEEDVKLGCMWGIMWIHGRITSDRHATERERNRMEDAASDVRPRMSPEDNALLDEIIGNLAKSSTYYDSEVRPRLPSDYVRSRSSLPETILGIMWIHGTIKGKREAARVIADTEKRLN